MLNPTRPTRRPLLNRLVRCIAMSALVTFIGGSTGLAQMTLEVLDDVQRSEASVIRGISVNDATFNPDLNVYLLCTAGGSGADYGYVDTTRDGYADTIRQYGAAMVSAAQWQQSGPRVLAPLRNQATLRSQGAIAQTISVHVIVSNGMTDRWDLSGDEIEDYLRSDESIRITANEILRGSGVSGVRLVSLPSMTNPNDSDGVCLLVRYDAPLRATGLQAPARVLPLAGEPRPGDEPRYTVPRPGTAGDF